MKKFTIRQKIILKKIFVGKKISESKISEFETLAQKEAIKIS